MLPVLLYSSGKYLDSNLNAMANQSRKFEFFVIVLNQGPQTVFLRARVMWTMSETTTQKTFHAKVHDRTLSYTVRKPYIVDLEWSYELKETSHGLEIKLGNTLLLSA